jgi:hypothetical protein
MCYATRQYQQCLARPACIVALIPHQAGTDGHASVPGALCRSTNLIRSAISDQEDALRPSSTRVQCSMQC